MMRFFKESPIVLLLFLVIGLACVSFGIIKDATAQGKLDTGKATSGGAYSWSVSDKTKTVIDKERDPGVVIKAFQEALDESSLSEAEKNTLLKDAESRVVQQSRYVQREIPARARAALMDASAYLDLTQKEKEAVVILLQALKPEPKEEPAPVGTPFKTGIKGK